MTDETRGQCKDTPISPVPTPSTPNNRNDGLLAGLFLGGYATLLLTWAALWGYGVVQNRQEDKTAIAKVDVLEGNVLSSTRGYVAFDKSGCGQIDEIKEYGRCMVGGRSLMSLPYTLRYHSGDTEFERIREKYFSPAPK